MRYHDVVYGKVDITEAVILDLLRSPSLQRLKGVDQAGFLKPFRPDEDSITRFEHSVGVFLLLRSFGASIEEQVAGLIHDVSHTAFSHCADYVSSHQAQQQQTHQDDIFEEFVNRSEIPHILAHHGMETSYLLNDAHFPLKETMLPDLCADRIDYSLRTAIAAHVCSQEEVHEMLQALTVEGVNWVFRSKAAALRYATLFSFLNKNCYSGLTSAVMFHTVGSVLRYAMQQRYITYEELYTTDTYVLEALFNYSDDKELQKLLDRMYNKVPYCLDTQNFHARVFCKSRVVDPLCYHDGKVERLSCVHALWEARLHDEMVPVSYCIRFEDVIPS